VRQYFDISINSGNSGGPIIDVESGLVIGVVLAKIGTLDSGLQEAAEALAKLPSQRTVQVRGVSVPEGEIIWEIAKQTETGTAWGVTPADLNAFLAANTK
jgi:S1-C subfamily serine protease